jgi:hypothetical protein
VLWFIFAWKGFISTRLSSKATLIGNGFCLQICEVCGFGNHSHEDLVKFGYRSERQVEKFKEFWYNLATCWEPIV